ncbi:hypothetical protein EGW08_004557 [Elysia chlorotica]|uniref:RNA-binding region-containing protein 3 n=1 Tax=Elysia chlorotica TaxID=188477 RepID=A0A433U1N2_ELYCH|nr:hypothetical protein EGW08_004557 [Elysia chlorotica]
MEEATLLFKHLPMELSMEERKDLLHYLGATRVQVMPSAGSMKNTAFAVFQNREEASKIVKQLHQVEFLGSKLKVEFAHSDKARVSSIVDNEGLESKKDPDQDTNKNDAAAPEMPALKEIKFDETFQVWGVKHQRRPDLYYLYPPPTPSTLTNIMHTLAAVPRFYVQVLHLMNKMDLPAPFGAVTSAPPVHPDVRGYVVTDDAPQQEMDISSSTESELESDEEEKTMRSKDEVPLKRPLKKKTKHQRKWPRLTDLKDDAYPQPEFSAAETPSLREVFEQALPENVATGRKIELKLPSNRLLPQSSHPVPPPPPSQFADPMDHYPPPSLVSPHTSHWSQSQSGQPSDKALDMHHGDPSRIGQSGDSQQHGIPAEQNFPRIPADELGLRQQQQQQQHLSYPSSLPQQSTESSASATKPQQLDQASTGGFGILQPRALPKEPGSSEEETYEKEWTKSKFISSSELKRLKLSHSEMKEYSVFRRYNQGNPSCRLYIKNLAKQVTEEDIHWVFGRYVDWDDPTEKFRFDIRLMKEGRMKGQAFVALPSEEAASLALRDTNGLLLREKPMVVQFARTAKAQEDGSSKP